MTVHTATESNVYYDPYDVGINADPYPVYARLRDEAPLYYNEPHDFYALSRFDDVERGLGNHETFISGTRRHPRDHQGRHRDASGDPDLRRPADPHDPPAPAVAGVHSAAHGRTRTTDP